MARTIDNLGIELSIEYAKGREQLDETLIKEARSIPMQTQIDVTAPSYPMELDTLFGVTGSTPWADFIAPRGYYEQKGRLFTGNQLIPSLGTAETRENQQERVSQIAKKYAPSEKEPSWEQKIEFDEEEKEKNIVKKLLTSVDTLTKDIVDFKSRCMQYQKG